MTDKEAALAIGEKFIVLFHENIALKALLMNLREPDGKPVPWRDYVDQDMRAPLSSQNVQNDLWLLRQGVDSSSDCNALLRSLHARICK
jgi:hypothetical protein